MTQAGEVIQEGGQEADQEIVIEIEDVEVGQEVGTEEEEEAEVGIAMIEIEMIAKVVNQPEVNDKHYGTNLLKVMKILLLSNSRL